MSTPPDVETFVAIGACAQLVADYGYAADHDDLELFLSVFAPDASCARADGSVMHGHDELRAFFLGRPAGRPPRCHVASNVRVRLLDPDRATGTSITVVYPLAGSGSEPGAAPVSIIEYADEFSRAPDGWRIQTRRGTPRFRAAA